MNVNLKKLADLAGVSVATVSKAFAGSDEISEKTKQHIFTIAKEYGIFDKYNKNKFSKRVIAVICPEIISNYYSMLISILNREIEAQGCIMALSISNFREECIEELFSYYSSYCNADGIIIIGSRNDLKNSTRVPAVFLASGRRCEGFDSISMNIEVAIDEAIEYLKTMGHTKIGFAGELLTVSKQKIFEKAIRKAVLPLRKDWVKISNKRFEDAGMEIAQKWLAEGDLPTAILAAYDYIAIGLIQTLKENGIRVPEDISVIGMDDISIAPYLETPLSSIRAHHDEACKQAVELIMKKLDNPYYTTNEIIKINTEFIPRGSSGKAKS